MLTNKINVFNITCHSCDKMYSISQSYEKTNQTTAIDLPATHIAELITSRKIANNREECHLAKLSWWNRPIQPIKLNQTIESAVTEKLSKRILTNKDSTKRDVGTHQFSNSTALLQEDQQQQKLFFCVDANELQDEIEIKPYSDSKIRLSTTPIEVNTQLSEEDPRISQDSQLLNEDPKPFIGYINGNEDDQMIVTGYRRSKSRTLLCWISICLTGGILRLIMHWWKHWYLIATHRQCPLGEAEKVLIQEDYQGNHKTFYVRIVKNLNVQDFRIDQHGSCSDIDEKDFHFSVPTSSGQFKSYKEVRIFDCKQLRYIWDDQSQSFNKIVGLDSNISSSYFYQQKGLSVREQLSRRLIYGLNEITIPYKNVQTLLFLEVLNPFYVFQIFSVILWFAYNYYYYACVIVLMSAFGITMSIIQMKKNQDALRETVQNTGNALVLMENGEISELPTQRLVPGDIIEIPSDGCIMQCDAVLLSGNCILDESMLTGESVPVTKTPLPMKRDVNFDKKEHARHTLFSGTKVIQTRYIGSEKVLAIIINTGNITSKGGLIRSILYPPPVDYKFEKDSYKFIQVLALIAFVGFIYTLVSKITRGIDPVKIAVESLDLITIVVPPALPAAMTVGRLYAQKRLKKQNIYCISPRSINVAGSIDCCCFDKTGTLTEDGLDMWGVVPKSVTNQFQIPINQIERLPCGNLLFGMVTCHSITVMNGKLVGDPLDLKMFESTGWLLEDAQDVPDNQKYGLLHPTIVRQPKQGKPIEQANVNNMQRQSSVDDLLANVGLLNGEAVNDHGIVREFPFTSALQRMSVITKCLSEKNFKVYCKGSPEMLQQLCIKDSLPSNYSQQLAYFAKQGYRIIAMAFKSLSSKINYTKIQRLSRENIENSLEFLGFVILENRLKPDTVDVIKTLCLANMKTVMVTGDNILTALSVARDCCIVSPNQAVVTVNVRQKQNMKQAITPEPHFRYSHTSESQNMPHNYELYYTLDMDKKEYANSFSTQNCKDCKHDMKINFDIIDSELSYHQINGDVVFGSSSSYTIPNSDSLSSVKTVETWTHGDVEIGLNSPSDILFLDSTICSTCGYESWRQNYRFAMSGSTWQIIKDYFPNELQTFITRGAIFARMSPEHKQSLIIELQNIDYCVAMCGDGANDCGALKAANTGISLSETESAIASPFTSRSATIACVPKIIKEGRAALVTSFGIFKYMAAYSLVQFVSVMILYSIDSNLTDKQYLYIDLGLISVFAFFFGKTEAYDGQLVKQVPLVSLISLSPLLSIILHLTVVVAFQVAGWFHVHAQSWFTPFELSDSDHLGCYENYTMFAISSFQYIILAIVFSKGAPYRKPIWTNWAFCTALTINICVVIYLVIYPAAWIANFFQIVMPTEMNFRYILLIYGIASLFSHIFVESIIVEMLIFKKIQTRRSENVETSNRKYLQIEHNLKLLPNWPTITKDYSDCAKEEESIQMPTYVEISAEQNCEIPLSTNKALNNFFENIPT